MPTYEYVCKGCGEHLEVVQSFIEPALTTCAMCGGDLRKVFGNVGIVFKGSGFYKTDSRTASSATGSKARDDGAKAGGDGEAASKEPAGASTPSGSSTSGSTNGSASGAAGSGSSTAKASAAAG
jgi:putative FmdB family regulatory protein